MAQLDLNYGDQVLEIIYNANEYIDQFDRFRIEVLNRLQTTIRTDSSSFFLFDDTLRPTDPVAINLAEQYLQSYQAHYHRLNPFDPIHVQVPSRSVLVDRDVLDFPVFKTSPMFTEFLAPQQTFRQMIMYLKSNQSLIGFIGLHRSDERDSFSDTELSIAEKIAPFLSQSLEKARLFNETINKTNLMQSAINQMPMGVATYDMNFHMLFQNERARQIISLMRKKSILFQKLCDEQKPLPKIVYQNCLRLKKQASLYQWKRMPLPMAFTIPISNRVTYAVRIEILFEHGEYGTNTRQPIFLLSLDEDRAKAHYINEEKLKTELGFTKREIEIIIYIFKGLKNPEIADLLNIRCGTVKNHLKKIFYKMGVNTRTSLIYEALAISDGGCQSFCR